MTKGKRQLHPTGQATPRAPTSPTLGCCHETIRRHLHTQLRVCPPPTTQPGLRVRGRTDLPVRHLQGAQRPTDGSKKPGPGKTKAVLGGAVPIFPPFHPAENELAQPPAQLAVAARSGAGGAVPTPPPPREGCGSGICAGKRCGGRSSPHGGSGSSLPSGAGGSEEGRCHGLPGRRGGQGEIAAASAVKARNSVFRGGGQNHWESSGGRRADPRRHQQGVVGTGRGEGEMSKVLSCKVCSRKRLVGLGV